VYGNSEILKVKYYKERIEQNVPKIGLVPGIEPRPLDLKPGTLNITPQRRSIILTRLSGPSSRPTTSQIILAPGIEPGPLNLYPGTLTTGLQWRSI
jgi:hypothetical protein